VKAALFDIEAGIFAVKFTGCPVVSRKRRMAITGGGVAKEVQLAARRGGQFCPAAVLAAPGECRLLPTPWMQSVGVSSRATLEFITA
jgi:hypothetical protein